MATFVKFNKFVLNLAHKVFNFNTDTLKVALSNSAPTASTNNQLSDITEISYTNLSARTITTTSSTQTSGTYKLVLADLVLTASGGSVAAFRYVIIYDDTATNDELVGYYDYGSSLTLNDTDTFTIDFDASAGFFTLA